MDQSFAAAVANWEKKAEAQKVAVMHAALRRLDAEIVANTPVVTGNTRKSRSVSTLGAVTINWKANKFRDPEDAINNAIAGAEVSATVWFGFRAPWARKLEEKHGILRLAAQRWRQIVEEAVRSLKDRA